MGTITSALLQVAIAVCLLVSGSLWLVYTPSIADLILNAVALSYVMQCDELIYNVMVPSKVKTMIRAMEPLALKSERDLRERSPSAPPRSVPVSLGMFAFVGIISIVFIKP